MAVGIIGLGYVGLTMAACLTSRGIEICGYDIDPAKMSKFSAGEAYIMEKDLQDLMTAGHDSGKLGSANSIDDLVKRSDIIFIAVGTPSHPDGSINLSYVLSAAADIGIALRTALDRRVIVVKSTVTPGAAENVIAAIEASSLKEHGVDFDVCINPEFLREGQAVSDFMAPDKIVIGAADRGALMKLCKLYRDFHGGGVNIVATNYANAGLIKYANNAFLATKISFINTIASICEKIPGADVNVIRDALYMDARIAPHFLNAGMGYGGSCFGKDLNALINLYIELGVVPGLLEEVEIINKHSALEPLIVITREAKELGLHRVKKQKIGILGLSFKPGTDDIRDSPAIRLIKLLTFLKYKNIMVHDPGAMENAYRELGDSVKFAAHYTDVLDGASWVIVATDWDEYKDIGGDEFARLMKRSNVFDGRRIYNAAQMIEAGVNYYGTGYGKY